MTNAYLTGGETELLVRRQRPKAPADAPRAGKLVLERESDPAPPANLPLARAPLGTRVFAVGDIHGRADLLDSMLAKIAEDVDREPTPARPVIVFLGDYVDRGRQSREVIDRLLAIPRRAFECYFLLGNHDRALLKFLHDPLTGPSWLNLGGAQTLYSYGVRLPPHDVSERSLRFTASALRAAMPPAHFAFLTKLRLYVRLGDYLFVHAGLRHGKSLAQQAEIDMLEIREPFLKKRARWPFVVVHGHSPVAEARRLPAGIALDTGAYATGKLSAVRLEGDQVSFLST